MQQIEASAPASEQQQRKASAPASEQQQRKASAPASEQQQRKTSAPASEPRLPQWAGGLTLMGEQAWVQRAQRGDPEALAWLVRSYTPRLSRLFLRVFGPRQDLEDLVQTSFLELLRALPGFRHESSFATFLTGIAVRVGRRALRPVRVVQKAVELERADHVSHDISSPDEQARSSELLRRVHTILAEVAEPKRVAFLLWALEGLTPADIAFAMQASLPATRSRIFYAQKELLAAAQRDPYLREWLEEHMS